jgi:hypothetical protein
VLSANAVGRTASLRSLSRKNEQGTGAISLPQRSGFEYKFFKLEQGERLAERPFVLACISDQHAISVAEMLTLSGRDVEVWQGERLIGRVKG